MPRIPGNLRLLLFEASQIQTEMLPVRGTAMTEEFPDFHAREQHANVELRAIAAELHQLARTIDVKLDLILAQGEEDSKRIEELEKLLDERWQHLLHRIGGIEDILNKT
jgi:hypothetical protein